MSSFATAAQSLPDDLHKGWFVAAVKGDECLEFVSCRTIFGMMKTSTQLGWRNPGCEVVTVPVPQLLEWCADQMAAAYG